MLVEGLLSYLITYGTQFPQLCEVRATINSILQMRKLKVNGWTCQITQERAWESWGSDLGSAIPKSVPLTTRLTCQGDALNMLQHPPSRHLKVLFWPSTNFQFPLFLENPHRQNLQFLLFLFYLLLLSSFLPKEGTKVFSDQGDVYGCA